MAYTRDTYPFKYPANYDEPEKPGAWPGVDVMALMCQTGFFEPDDGRALIALQVWIGESSLQPLVDGPVIWKPNNMIHLARAKGMFQFLDVYHEDKAGSAPAFPDMTLVHQSELYNPHFAWPRAWHLMHKNGAGFTYVAGQYNLNLNWWSAYANGMYMTRDRRNLAYAAQEQYLDGLDG